MAVPKRSAERPRRPPARDRRPAADAVRPGGRLVYAVCTFTRAETDAVCDALFRRRPDLDPIETDGPDGRTTRHRLWPHRHGCDAMFVAAFAARRRSSALGTGGLPVR